MSASTEGLQRLLRQFPSSAYSFAYGSAVFPQKNQKVGKMVDLIFVVDNPKKWHSDNLKQNSRHYSFLKYFGTGTIINVQESWAAGVYYNTLVKVDDQMIKYGVISTHDLVDDLKNWTHAYISGRLHKPVLELSPPTNSQLVKCIKQNRVSALRAVLLQLPTQSRKWDLYHGITELSYFGDSRMRLGENPNKVGNILSGNVQRFDEIYQPIIQELNPLVEGSSTTDGIIQDTSSEARLNHLLHLPFHLQQCICRESGRDPALHDIEEVLVEICSLPMLGFLVRKALGNIVWKSSIRQTAQGILTAGPFKAVRYGLEKIGKKISGSRESPKFETTSSSPPFEVSKSDKPVQKKASPNTGPVPLRATPGSGVSATSAELNQTSSESQHTQHVPNLSDLEFPFPNMKRSGNDPEEGKLRQGLITIKVKGQEEEVLKSKAKIRIPPVFDDAEPYQKKINQAQTLTRISGKTKSKAQTEGQVTSSSSIATKNGKLTN